MGILNVTPDSFSDGGQYFRVDCAVERACAMVEEGASIIDVGGESTGPGSVSVSAKEEIIRVILVIRKLSQVLPKNIIISIDTWKASVAAAALESGAHMVNDVTALRGDSGMAQVVACARCPIVLMYAKDNTPRTTRDPVHYDDVAYTISLFLQDQIDFAIRNGVDEKNIIIDPGMGAFVSGDARYSFEILHRLREFSFLQKPILVGASRKSFLGGAVSDRLEAGLACAALAVAQGASIIRTHDVQETVRSLHAIKTIE